MTPPTSSVTQHRRPVGYWLVALLLAVLCGSRELAAQESPPKPADTSSAADTKKAGPKSSELLAPDGTDVVRILGDDGRVYTLPAGRTLKQVLEALEKAEKPQAPAPDFYIASLSLDGKADSDRDRVEFNVTLEVQVQQTKKSVRIPLRFNEATMISQSSDRPGSMTFEATERNAGPVCWLTGEGKHVLKLKVSVPARRSATSQRLQLSLPATVQSRLVIEVPQSQLTVKAIDPLTAKPLESLDVQTEVIDVQRSRIVAHGLGTSLDLSWQGARESAPAKRELSSRTLMLAEVLPDGILLQASQTVRALQGTFSSVSVTLPEGFKIDSVEDRSGVPLPFRQQDNGRAVVSLNGETSGPVELIWYLRASIAGAAAKIQITNLVLDDATRQDGMLGVVRPESSTLRSLDAESQGLERIGAVTFRRFAETSLKRADASVSQAFSFDGACRAVFQLDRVVPRFIVRPTYELAFGDESVELEAKLELTVFRGTLESLTLKWPNWREEGWQIDVESEISVVPETGSSADEVVLGFGKALDRRNQPTVIQVRGRRQLTRAEDKTKLTLPTVVAPRRTIASLVVKNADNIESRLVAAEGTDLRLVGDSGATASKTIDAPENQRLRRYELHSETANFNATAMTQTQSVTCQPRTTLSVDESRIRVTQVFDYSVSYERLSAVRIVVPKLLADRAGGLGAQFWLVKSNEEVLWQVDGPNVERIPLTPVPTGVDVDGRQLRLAFPQPIWGHFRIAAQYSVPLSSAMVANESQTETVPILLCSDSTPKTSQLQVRAPDNVTVKIASGDWQPEVALERFPTWRADGGQRAVELDFKVSPTLASDEFSIRKAGLRVRFDQGSARTQAIYQIDGSVKSLVIEMPAKIARGAIRFWWDGHELESDQIRAGDESGKLRLNLATFEVRDRHILALEFATEEAPQFGMHNFVKTIAPRFASDVWLAESQWEITLPFDQHLFVYPTALAPKFQWHRMGILWSRLSIGTRSDVAQWALSTDAPESDSPLADDSLVPLSFLTEGSGNRYLFSAFGRPTRIEFQTMSQPGIVLTGAGLALAFGFILLKVPGTRHVLTFLLLGVAMALVGVWHFEPVQLLLQPAVIGVLLALIAAAIETRIKRRQRIAFVTLSPPSEIAVHGSSRNERAVQPQVESAVGP